MHTTLTGHPLSMFIDTEMFKVLGHLLRPISSFFATLFGIILELKKISCQILRV